MICCVLRRDPLSDPRRASLIEVELVLLQVRAADGAGLGRRKIPQAGSSRLGTVGLAVHGSPQPGYPIGCHGSNPCISTLSCTKVPGWVIPISVDWIAAPSQLQQLEYGNGTTLVVRKALLLSSRFLHHAKGKKCMECRCTSRCAPFPCGPWISPNSSSTPNSPDLDTIAWEIPSFPQLGGQIRSLHFCSDTWI